MKQSKQSDEFNILLAEMQAIWPSLTEQDLLILGLRSFQTLSNKTHYSSAPVFTTEELASEIWKPLPDFKGCEVSSLGRIRGGIYGAKRIRKISCQTGGYAVVMLRGSNGPEQKQVSKIVAAVFIGKAEEGEVVNHINGNKLDNRAANLEWTSQKNNIRHSNESGLRSRKSRKMSSLGLTEKNEIQRFYSLIKKGLLAKIYGIKSSEIQLMIKQN